MLRVSATMPWPGNAESPWMSTGRTFPGPSSPRRSWSARAIPSTTGFTASRWLGLGMRMTSTLPRLVSKIPLAP